jgi:hypothetical protein
MQKSAQLTLKRVWLFAAIAQWGWACIKGANEERRLRHWNFSANFEYAYKARLGYFPPDWSAWKTYRTADSSMQVIAMSDKYRCQDACASELQSDSWLYQSSINRYPKNVS